MKTKPEIRKKMLEVLKDAITVGHDIYVPEKIIRFYDNEHHCLCELGYNSLEQRVEGEKVSYLFLASDNGYVLRGTTIAAGRVLTLEIQGAVAGINELDDSLIIGTVGNIISKSSDLKFNMTDWPNEANITVTRMAIVLPQGT